VRHSSPSGNENWSPRPRAVDAASGAYGWPPPQREAPENRHTAWLEDSRFREPSAVAVAVEETGDANPLGVIATEPGVDTVDLLEPIDEARGGQRVRSKPSAEIGERSNDRR
jgi:hypothetical protein